MQTKRSTKFSTAKSKRDPVKERTWRKYMADQAASGLSASTFCQDQGLNVNNFGRWRLEIARRDREVQVPAKSANPFVPIQIVALPQIDIGLEILLPGNAVIKVTDESPLKLLARVLMALEVQC